MRKLFLSLIIVLAALTVVRGQITITQYFLPDPYWISPGAPTLSAASLNASGDKTAFVVQMPKDGTLDKCEVYASTVGNNPDNGMRISFQDVSATDGNPDGTQDQYRDVTGAISAGWMAPGLMTSDGTDTGTKRTVAAGDLVACVVDFVNFTVGDSINFSGLSAASGLMNNWYWDDASTGTYAKSNSMPIVAFKYNDNTYAQFPAMIWPYTAVNTRSTFNTGSTPDERALRFQVPYTTRTTGGWARVYINGTFEIILYSAADGVLGTASFDPDIRVNNNSENVYWFWPDPITLTANTTYRLSVKPTSATNITMYDVTIPSNAYLAAFPGGAQWYSSTRTDAGSWTDSDVTVPAWMGLLINGMQTGGESSSVIQ